MGEIVASLPAFELAGQVRVRRSRLIAWIEERERSYQATAGWAAHALGKGVAYWESRDRTT